MVNDNFYLAEAFKSMKLLEDDFDLTADNGVIDELQSFVADDVEAPAEEVIIDVEADNEDELQDNYIGKVILECDCCHTRIYKNEEEVVIDDESGKANIDEVCPVCNGEFGWNVIGKIEPFKEDEFEETEEETVEEPGEEHEFSDEEVDEALKEALNEDLKVITSLSEYKPWSGAEETYRKIEDAGLLDELEMILEDMYPDGIGMTELNDILWFDADTILSYLGLGEEDEEFDESYDSLKAVSKKLKESIKRRKALKGDLNEEFIKVDSYDKAKELGKGTRWAISGNYPGYNNDKDGERLFKEYSKNYDIFISPNTKTGKIISKKTGEERVFDKEDNFLYTVKRAKKESEKLRGGKSLKESWYRGAVGVEFIDNGQWNDPQLEYDGHIFNYWDIEDALWHDFLDATGHTDDESGNGEVEAEFDAFVQDNCIPYLEDVIAGGYFGESCADPKLNEDDEHKKTYKCYDCGYEVELSDDEYDGQCPNCGEHHGFFELDDEDEFDESLNESEENNPESNYVVFRTKKEFDKYVDDIFGILDPKYKYARFRFKNDKLDDKFPKVFRKVEQQGEVWEPGDFLSEIPEKDWGKYNVDIQQTLFDESLTESNSKTLKNKINKLLGNAGVYPETVKVFEKDGNQLVELTFDMDPPKRGTQPKNRQCDRLMTKLGFEEVESEYNDEEGAVFVYAPVGYNESLTEDRFETGETDQEVLNGEVYDALAEVAYENEVNGGRNTKKGFQKAENNFNDKFFGESLTEDIKAYASGEHKGAQEDEYGIGCKNSYYGYVTIDHPSLGEFAVSVGIEGDVRTDGKPWEFLQSKKYKLTPKQIEFVNKNKRRLSKLMRTGDNEASLKESRLLEYDTGPEFPNPLFTKRNDGTVSYLYTQKDYRSGVSNDINKLFPTMEDAKKYDEYRQAVRELEFVEDDIAEYTEMINSVDEYKSKIEELKAKKSELESKIASLDGTWKELTTNESLTEDLNEVEVHTEDGDVNVSKEDSKVTIDFGTSNVEDDFALEGGDEMIAPLTDEEQTEIEDNLPDGEEELDFSLEDEEVPEEGEEELDIEDFDEETFDNVGESYMRRVYDNVNSFNTTKVSTSKNKMMVEGTINFKSGKKKDTKFVFEGLRNTKRGKVVFKGLNETFSKSNKAFMLKGTLKNKKFVTESMIYNYYAKSLNESDGKSVKVYGRAVAKK